MNTTTPDLKTRKEQRDAFIAAMKQDRESFVLGAMREQGLSRDAAERSIDAKIEMLSNFLLLDRDDQKCIAWLAGLLASQRLLPDHVLVAYNQLSSAATRAERARGRVALIAAYEADRAARAA